MMKHYLKRDEAYRLVNFLKKKGVLEGCRVEYVHAPRSDIYTALRIFKKLENRELLLYVNFFSNEIYNELHNCPELITDAFKSMEVMPQDLLLNARLQTTPCPPPKEYFIDFTIHSKEKHLTPTENHTKYYWELKYAFLNDKVITFEWFGPFDLLRYATYNELKNFCKTIQNFEKPYEEFKHDRHRWMEAYEHTRL